MGRHPYRSHSGPAGMLARTPAEGSPMIQFSRAGAQESGGLRAVEEGTVLGPYHRQQQESQGGRHDAGHDASQPAGRPRQRRSPPAQQRWSALRSGVRERRGMSPVGPVAEGGAACLPGRLPYLGKALSLHGEPLRPLSVPVSILCPTSPARHRLRAKHRDPSAQAPVDSWDGLGGLLLGSRHRLPTSPSTVTVWLPRVCPPALWLSGESM